MADVKTNYGDLRGLRHGRSLAFFGIPYAAAPVGDLRFRAPQKPVPWAGVRDASRPGPIPPQEADGGLLAVLGARFPKEPQSEDCLFLNVFTPATDGARRPVMVWIHGGSFIGGSGSVPMYDGKQLVERGDVVVVTINYRLGALGFLCIEEDQGEPFANFGMLDQIAALEWVRDEIAAFGGDPENVTIFGESAGGMSVGALLASPPARGLFHKAIAQSGAGHHAISLAEARLRGERFAKLAGIPQASRRAMAALDVDGIRRVQADLDRGVLNRAARGLPLDLAFQPVVDGYFLRQMPIDAVRQGDGAEVPLLVGTTADETKLLALLAPVANQSNEDSLERAVAARLADEADVATGREVLAVYREARLSRGDSIRPIDLYAAVDRDHMFAVPADRLATAQSRRQPQTYAYRFDWKSPAMGGALGACHALEVPFVFGTLGIAGLSAITGQGAAAACLAAVTMDAWVSFARTGEPSVAGVEWPAFEEGERLTMVLDAACEVVERPHDAELACWEGRR